MFPGTVVCSPGPAQNTLFTCQRPDRLKCVAVALGEEFGACESPATQTSSFIKSLILKVVFIRLVSGFYYLRAG